MPVNIAPPPYKVSLFFGMGNSGWSETLWLYTPVLASFANAKLALQTLVSDRLKLSCADTIFLAARVSNTNKPNHAELYSPSDLLLNPNVGTYVPTASGSRITYSLPPDQCILIRMEDANQNRGYYRVHGVPDIIYQGENDFGGILIPDAAWSSAFTTFQTDLVSYAMIKTRGANAFTANPTVHSYRLSKHNVGRVFDTPTGHRPVA